MKIPKNGIEMDKIIEFGGCWYGYKKDMVKFIILNLIIADLIILVAVLKKYWNTNFTK